MRWNALLLACCLGPAIAGPKNDRWQRSPSDDVRQADAPKLAEDKFAEIPASKLESAQERLAKTALSELKADYELQEFAPRGFSCGRGERAFLARALYEYGERGYWEIFLLGQDLLVRNSAYGAPAPTHRSALVLCLKKAPKRIYVEVSGAM